MFVLARAARMSSIGRRAARAAETFALLCGCVGSWTVIEAEAMPRRRETNGWFASANARFGASSSTSIMFGSRTMPHDEHQSCQSTKVPVLPSFNYLEIRSLSGVKTSENVDFRPFSSVKM